MFVVMVASECAPVAQVGGLGQVIFGLSRELELRGHAVEIILPKYDCMHYDRQSESQQWSGQGKSRARPCCHS